MQCPSCNFQNMPGSGNCARCGAMLALASIAIDVHPPRASALGKSAFGLWRFRRVGYRFWNLLPKEIPWPRIDREAVNMELPTVLRAVVPGWANIHVGQRDIGWIYLAAYICCALSGFLLMGTPFGGILLGIAFAIHVASIVTAVTPKFDSYGNRLIFTAACGLVLTLFVYLPIGSLLSRVAVPLSINGNVAPFSPGDVVWYRPTSRAEPGQYILYNSADTIQGRRYVRAGMRINQVIAVAGQTLTWEDGKLFADGKAAPAQLSPDCQSMFSTLKIPSDSVLVDPANLGPDGPALWYRLAVVPINHLTGVVFFQSWPWSRAGFF